MEDILTIIIFGWKLIIGLGLFFFSFFVAGGILNSIIKFIKWNILGTKEK